MEIIKMQGVDYIYPPGKNIGEKIKALDNISVSIKKGEFVVILGRNGSGKSTFARLLNAMVLPDRGTVTVHGLDSSDSDQLWEIRRLTGMVFPDPENQIVCMTVEEDVAFGPENLGLSSAEIETRVQDALQAVGMAERAGDAPHLLTRGEKHRLALAGVLAMKPECIVLDEATSLLDWPERWKILTLMRRLNRDQGITILHITHHMDETEFADRVLVLDAGRIVHDAPPDQIFTDVERMKDLGLGLPPLTELFHGLRQDGFDLPQGLISSAMAVEILKGFHIAGSR